MAAPPRPEVVEEVKRIFSSYLKTHQHRKTPERFAILEEIYERNDHFDVEELYAHMKRRNYRVSRATVYNTLDLLVACDLVARHQFGQQGAVYERSYGYKQHDHLICLDCGRVEEFCDPRLEEIQQDMGHLLRFGIHHHSLHLYGNCGLLAEPGGCPRRLAPVLTPGQPTHPDRGLNEA